MRLEPGSAVAVHRHTGDVHAFNLAGTREIFGTGERVGPGNYVYEPAGTIDGWGAVGDEPCVVYIKVVGTIEYLGENGEVIESVNAETQRAVYLAWCREHGVEPATQTPADPPERTPTTGRTRPMNDTARSMRAMCASSSDPASLTSQRPRPRSRARGASRRGPRYRDHGRRTDLAGELARHPLP